MTILTGNRIGEIQGIERDALTTRVNNAERARRPRALTAEQIAALSELLRGFTPGPVHLMAIAGNGEAYDLAMQLRAAFIAAGFRAMPITGLTTSDSPRGVILSVRSVEDQPPYAGRVQHFLQTISIDVFGRLDAALTTGTLDILVGEKPHD